MSLFPRVAKKFARLKFFDFFVIPELAEELLQLQKCPALRASTLLSNRGRLARYFLAQ